MENKKAVTRDLQIAEIFNNHFSNVIRSLCDRNIPHKIRYCLLSQWSFYSNQ